MKAMVNYTKYSELVAGDRFARLVVLSEVPKSEWRNKNCREYRCKCDCGNIVNVGRANLLDGNTKSCGCLWRESLLRAKYDVIGKRFGRLVVNEITRKNSSIYCKCKCDCGNEKIVSVYYLLHGNTKSCGCLQKENLKKNAKKMTEDITGKVFNELTAIRKADSYIGINGHATTCWLFRCSCGREVILRKSNVKKGTVKSCGHIGGSIAEHDITKYLIDHNITFVKEASFEELRNPGTRFKLYFDYKIYRKNGSFFLLEHQGVQHFVARNKNDNFGKQQREVTDKIKKEYCKQHGITLYETLYNEDYIAKLEDILTKELEEEVIESEHGGEG